MTTLSLTSALNGGEWSAPQTGHFTSGKVTQYSLHRRLGVGGSVGRDWAGKFCLPWDSIQPVASCCTNYTIPVPPRRNKLHKLLTVLNTVYKIVYQQE